MDLGNSSEKGVKCDQNHSDKMIRTFKSKKKASQYHKISSTILKVYNFKDLLNLDNVSTCSPNAC